jgi:zinc transport system permease protein
MWDALLKYDWMQHAFLAGIMIGLISPLIGIYLVVRRLSLIAEALSHITLSGMAIGLFLQREFAWFQAFNPLYVGMLLSVAGSFAVERIRRMYRTFQELAIPLMLSGGMALGVVLISAAGGFNVDLAGYLFGQYPDRVRRGTEMDGGSRSGDVAVFHPFLQGDVRAFV